MMAIYQAIDEIHQLEILTFRDPRAQKLAMSQIDVKKIMIYYSTISTRNLPKIQHTNEEICAEVYIAQLYIRRDGLGTWRTLIRHSEKST